MQRKSIYLYSALVACIVGIISLVFMLKEMRKPTVVIDYMRDNSSATSHKGMAPDNNKSKSNISHVKGKTTTTKSTITTHELSLSYGSPQAGSQECVKVYKLTGKPEIHKKPAVGDVVLIPLPLSKEGKTDTITYTCELDSVKDSTQEGAQITALHGKLTKRDAELAGNEPVGDAYITIIDNHISAKVHDKANERFYHIFYTKNAESGEIEYIVEETDTTNFPQYAESKDNFHGN